jgi:hypothetical protein
MNNTYQRVNIIFFVGYLVIFAVVCGVVVIIAVVSLQFHMKDFRHCCRCSSFGSCVNVNS